MDKTKKLTAMFIMWVASIFGGLSMVLFAVFLFVGPFGIVKMELTEDKALFWNGILSLTFFFQHSCMIRRGFGDVLSRIIKSYYIDAVFAIISGIVLTCVVVFWQPATVKLLELDGLSRFMARIIFIFAIGGLGWGVYSFKSFDPFGSTLIKSYLNGKSPQTQMLEVNGPYLWVRHPLYLCALILLWSCPDLTTDRLLLNVLWTIWIYLGTILEERDLLWNFGDKYRAYQKEVPMLIPWKRPLKKKNL